MPALLRKLKEVFHKSTVDEHKLFLRWVFTNAASIALFILLGATGFFAGVHGPPLVAAAIALTVTSCASLYMGRLYWRADIVKESLQLSKDAPKDDYRLTSILHSSERIFYTVGVLQIIGMLGAMFGYREITHSTDIPDAQQAVHVATQGLGNGLTATIIGVLASLILGVLHFELEHELTKPS